MNTINEEESQSNDESTLMSTSRRGVAPAMRSSQGVTGCEDTIFANNQKISNNKRLKLGKTIKVATWNCGGLSYTIREMCSELKYDILALTETHDKGQLTNNRNFITSEPAPPNDSFSGVALLLSDRIAKCVRQWKSGIADCIR